MPFLDAARGPENMRIYAIGDIHGRLDLLRAMHARIAADLIRRPFPRFRIIHLGDYVDRGPDSAGVIEHLIDFCSDGDAVCLGGNHDLYIAAFLEHPAEAGGDWLSFGGDATLRSYGIDPAQAYKPRGLKALGKALREAMPASHKRFFATLPFHEMQGDFLFVHAGIKPGKPLRKQKVSDVTMIREPFLKDRRDHGVVVVHGHTTASAPQIRHNRIGIDTKAHATGILSCLVIDGPEKGLLTPEGWRPLPPPE